MTTGPFSRELLDRLNEAVRDQGAEIRNLGPVAHGDHASVTGTLPPDLVPGEALFLLTRVDGSGAAVTPAGWTLIEIAGRGAAFARVSGVAETPPTVSFTGGRPGDRSVAVVLKASP